MFWKNTEQEQNRDELQTAVLLSKKSLGQKSVEDGQQGAFNNEELVFHREMPPTAGIHSKKAMEMKDFEVQKGPSMPLKETGWLTLFKLIAFWFGWQHFNLKKNHTLQ